MPEFLTSLQGVAAALGVLAASLVAAWAAWRQLREKRPGPWVPPPQPLPFPAWTDPHSDNPPLCPEHPAGLTYRTFYYEVLGPWNKVPFPDEVRGSYRTQAECQALTRGWADQVMLASWPGAINILLYLVRDSAPTEPYLGPAAQYGNATMVPPSAEEVGP